MSPGTISNLNKKAYEQIEEWRSRPLTEKYPYVYVDGVYLKRNWGSEIQNVSILVAIGVNHEGYREILGAAEGMKEDRESWKNFFFWLKERGLKGIRLIIGDKCLGMLESIPRSSLMRDISAVLYTSTEMYLPSRPEQRCVQSL